MSQIEAPHTQPEWVMQCQALCKHYPQGDSQLHILNNVELSVGRGEMLAIVGPSGAGKTTLLHMLGGLDLPSSGKVLINGRDIAALDDAARSRLRNAELGFVYQFHHLLAEFSALENAAMPLLIAGRKRAEALAEAEQLLSRVGLAPRLDHRPAQLSGGERQRVAIARALVNKPACVLLDEPTGNLDADTAESVHGLLAELNREYATSLLVVTHDMQLAQRMDRTLALRAGQLQELPR
ncbi:lipoprotein-releasing ABC transporter ATP-binding protein LolD [Spongiibacter sp.]|uniref:lipoprotein-releasing ABC transporter ATP-binding protein LolD n=1 Tax=Spongiibacter sp. TaxID=2024860 RepID=UPI003566F6F5